MSKDKVIKNFLKLPKGLLKRVDSPLKKAPTQCVYRQFDPYKQNHQRNTNMDVSQVWHPMYNNFSDSIIDDDTPSAVPAEIVPTPETPDSFDSIESKFLSHFIDQTTDSILDVNAKVDAIEDSVTDVPSASMDQFQNKKFKVAFSFAGGDARKDVEYIAMLLNKDEQLKGYIFYDYWYQHLLSVPGLDNVLQKIYRRAELDVVFLSENYSERDWCNIEWRTIKQRLYSSDPDIKWTLMLIKHGKFDAKKLGIEPTDGYIDAKEEGNESLTELITKRYESIQPNDMNQSHKRDIKRGYGNCSIQ